MIKLLSEEPCSQVEPEETAMGDNRAEGSGRWATNNRKRTQAVLLPDNPLMKICGSG